MAVRQPRYSKEEHARRGTELYEQQVRPQVEAENHGKIVAIDIDSGKFEVAENTLAACERLLARRPDAQIWCVRIGHRAVHRFGSRVAVGLLSLIFLIASLFPTAPVCAADKKDKSAPDEVKMNERARKATSKALEWLAARQNSDGSWSEGRYPHNTAITSFALLAFLSQGHLPNQGTYGPEVAKGCRFLLASARADGYLGATRGGGNMYCHAMATLALAELWGMTGDKDVKPVLTKAVNLIVGSQNHEGGWRYEPRPTGADISVTIMQVMALRAAKNSGLHVKDETMRRAISYIKRCYNRRIGGFSYMPGQQPGFARTAAGVCVLQLTGEYKATEIPEAIAFMKQRADERYHFWYGHYYASHAMHQVGGKDWQDWYKRICDTFLPMQTGDGSWSSRERFEVGPVYQTSIAVIILSVPMNYMPIFQR